MLLLTNKKHSPYLKILAILMAFIFSSEAVGYCLRVPMGVSVDRVNDVPISEEEIRKAIQYINDKRDDGEQAFSLDILVPQVNGLGLQRGKSVLIVGPGTYDYMGILLAQLGLEVREVDTEEAICHIQREFAQRFGLQDRIRVYDSYEGVKNQRFDYIFILGVSSYIISVGEFIYLLMHYDDPKVIANALKMLSDRMSNYLEPILPLLNANGGYLFHNDAFDERQKDAESTPFKLLQLFKAKAESFWRERGIYFSEVPINIDNFTLNPFNIGESRKGIVYKLKYREGAIEEKIITNRDAMEDL